MNPQKELHWSLWVSPTPCGPILNQRLEATTHPVLPTHPHDPAHHLDEPGHRSHPAEACFEGNAGFGLSKGTLKRTSERRTLKGSPENHLEGAPKISP